LRITIPLDHFKIAITRLTTIYDSFQFPDAVYQTLVKLGAEM